MAKRRKKRKHIYVTRRRTKHGFRVHYRKRKFSRRKVKARLARMRASHTRYKRRKHKKWGPSNPLYRWKKKHGLL